MAIYERDGKYHVQVETGYTLEGKRARRTRTCSSRREAERVERELIAEAALTQGRSDRITLARFIQDYWWPSKVETLRATTLKGYERDIRLRIIPAMGTMQVSQIKKMHVQSMCSKCSTWKVAKNARDTLRAILAEAVDTGLINRNPASGQIRLPEREVSPEQHNGEWLNTFEEHARFLEAVRGHDAEPIVVLGLCFGLRKGEILGLNWEDIDFERREITVRRTYTLAEGSPELTPPKTERSKRTIPIIEYAYEYLKAYRVRDGITRMSGAIVVNRRGSRLSPATAYKYLRRFTDSHDVPRVTTLTLRHSFATACVRAGVNVASISKWLGHTDVSVTLNKYVRPLMDDLHEDARVIEEAMNRSASCS